MQFFIEKVMAEATDTEMARVKVPGLDTTLDAVSDLRTQYRQDGTEGRMYGNEWRHVASIRGPILQVAEILDPEFLNGNKKKKFYAWLDAHPEWCAYDRRKGARRGDMLTFQNGIPII